MPVYTRKSSSAVRRSSSDSTGERPSRTWIMFVAKAHVDNVWRLPYLSYREVNNCWRMPGISLLWTRLVNSTSLLMNRRGSDAAESLHDVKTKSQTIPHRVKKLPDVGANKSSRVTEFPEAIEIAHHRPVGVDLRRNRFRLRRALVPARVPPLSAPALSHERGEP